MSNEEMDKGVQPLDGLLDRLGLKNADLVEKSTEQLTFKMVVKGRKGRKLTLNVQRKILTALNACLTEGASSFVLKDLFNYK